MGVNIVKIPLGVRFTSEAFHGSGQGVAGIIDRAFLRDFDGVPYLSGSALKGKFRFAAARTLRLTGERCCNRDEGWYCRSEYCLICQTFGSPRRQGLAVFSDAYPSDRQSWVEWIGESKSFLLAGPFRARTSVGISRLTRTSFHSHLFSTEVLDAAIAFEGEIRGRLTEEQVRLLRRAVLLIDYFGADSARGRGHCSIDLQEGV